MIKDYQQQSIGMTETSMAKASHQARKRRFIVCESGSGASGFQMQLNETWRLPSLKSRRFPIT
jgi:hypothetical protein